jgi:uncharacterized protein involved in exopolysaccharide biosynthesis
MEEKKKNDSIDLGLIIGQLWAKKKTFFKVWIITFVLASAYILCIPRTYSSEIKLAPEIDNSFSEGALGSIASSFGFDIGSMATTDAISPELYPELLATNDFVCLLFPMTVENKDNTLKTSYYEYLDKHQKSPWWSFISRWVKSLMPQDKDVIVGGGKKGTMNPLNLTRRQSMIAESVKDNIICSIDRKTSMITIEVTDQDPRICATIADSIRLKLQEFIIDYRTKKARIDVEYYRNLVAESKEEYEKARQIYAKYADTHGNSIMESVNSRKEELENELQLKNSNYVAYNTQLQASIAKLQQRTPAFTLLQGAAIPVKPSGPKRMIFVLAMLVLVSMITAGRILWKNGKTAS